MGFGVGIVDGEALWREAGRDFGPIEGHGDGGAGFGADAVGGGQGLAVAVLEIVEVNFALALGGAAFETGDIGETFMDELNDELSKKV